MDYITKEILNRFDKEYLNTLKTKEDILDAYLTQFALCLADNPSDVYVLKKQEIVNKIVNELYEALNN